MSAPLVWVVAPLGLAAVLLVLRRQETAVRIVGTVAALLFGLSVWNIPVGEAAVLGPFSFKLSSELTLLGRQLVLDDAARGVVGLVYLIVAVWFAGAFIARPGYLFVPVGLGVISLLVASVLVEPFLFAALFIEVAVLLLVPMLVPPGRSVGQGALRFLSFQTLGVPFILFTGWMLAGVDANPDSLSSVVPPAVLMGFGFAFLLAVFPFHTWLPMLAEEVHPYAAAFVFLVLPGIISLFGLGFLDRFAWLRESLAVYAMLRAVGFLMAVTGGVWAAFQRHLGRMLGFAAIVENGLALLAIGSMSDHSLDVFFLLFLARVFGYFVWAQALSAIARRLDNMDYRDLQGVGRVLPFTLGGLVLAQLSVAAFPLLAGFPARLALWETLSSRYPVSAFGALLGGAGVLIGALRTLAVSMMRPQPEQAADVPAIRRENYNEKVLFFVGGAILILLGVFPHWLTPLLARLPLAFEQFHP